MDLIVTIAQIVFFLAIGLSAFVQGKAGNNLKICWGVAGILLGAIMLIQWLT